MKKSFKTTMVVGGLAVAMTTGVFLGQALAAQPHMQAALDALKTARSELVAATANKGGHRAAAIRAVDTAIRETQIGISFAE
jgi:hypothetical protein